MNGNYVEAARELHKATTILPCVRALVTGPRRSAVVFLELDEQLATEFYQAFVRRYLHQDAVISLTRGDYKAGRPHADMIATVFTETGHFYLHSSGHLIRAIYADREPIEFRLFEDQEDEIWRDAR